MARGNSRRVLRPQPFREPVSLRAAEIALLVEELAPLAGSRVDAVRVHSDRLLTLDLRGPRGEVTLLLSAEPDLTRIHAATWRPPSPEEPLPLQAVLRREIVGARLAAIERPGADRVVALRLARASGPVTLLAELTGRNGNLFLLDAAGTIRAMGGRNLSTRRVLGPGAPWVAPAVHEPEPAPGRLAPVEGAPFPLSAAVESLYRRLEEERALAAASPSGRRRPGRAARSSASPTRPRASPPPRRTGAPRTC